MEENKPSTAKAGDDDKHVAKAASASPKFTKKMPSTPPRAKNVKPKQSSPVSRRSGNHMMTCKTLSGDIVATFRNAAGRSAHIRPMIAWLNEHDEAKNERFGIHHIVYEANPDAINFHKEDFNSNTGKTAWYAVFVSIVPDEDANKNNLANRSKFAQSIIDLNNNPAIQSKYEYGGTRLHYSGDTTPSDERECATLHSLLGPNQTMNIIKNTFRDEDGSERPTEDLLSEDGLLQLYFPADYIPQLRQQHGFPCVDAQQNTDTIDGITLPDKFILD